MKRGSAKSDFLPDIIAGLINTLISIVLAMALAAVIFTGSLSEYLPQGIGILLISTIVFAALSAMTASNPLLLHSPQDIPVVILALIAATVASSPDIRMPSDQLFQFVFIAIGVTSVLVGVFFFILGRFKLGRVVRFIPLPVIGGFLAGVGWLLVKFALSMMTSLELSLDNMVMYFEDAALFHWVPGLVFALVLLVANRYFKHYLLIPGMLLGGIILFYAVMFSQGISYAELETSGYLLGPFPSQGLFPGIAIEQVSHFRWGMYLQFLPMIATVMILSAIEALLNYNALENKFEEDFDLDKELRQTGFNNMLVGMAGAPAGFLRLSQTTLSYTIGAKSRIPSIMVAALCSLALVFGADALSVFPKLILGGLLLNLGLNFLVEWLVDTWKKLPPSDYFVIVLILIAIANIGFLEGVLVGLMVSTIFFVINYSKVKVVKHELSGRTFKSNVERSAKSEEILRHHEEQVLILSLQGFIFFGSTPQLLQPILNRIADHESVPLNFIVFDFRQVTGVDSSTINSFRKLRATAKKHHLSIVLCDLNSSLEQQLISEGLIPDDTAIIQIFEDLDHGLEWCEEKIIADNQPDSETVTGLESDDFSMITTGFSEYMEDHLIPANTVLINQGQDPGGIFFIESGEVSVVLNSGQDKCMRLKAMGQGTIVGEVSLYLESKATASVVAQVDCRIKFLSRGNFLKLNHQDPDKASQLHIFIVKLLSGRLAKSNKTITALMH